MGMREEGQHLELKGWERGGKVGRGNSPCGLAPCAKKLWDAAMLQSRSVGITPWARRSLSHQRGLTQGNAGCEQGTWGGHVSRHGAQAHPLAPSLEAKELASPCRAALGFTHMLPWHRGIFLGQRGAEVQAWGCSTARVGAQAGGCLQEVC